MQNANIGLVDITLTCHFEVKDAEVFGGAGSVGYTSVALKHAKAADQLVGIINNSVQCEGFLYAQRKSTADLLGVPVECVRAITYDENTFAYDEWKEACRRAETAYFNLLNWGLSPQEARAVLPNSLKTEVVMTANIREWRHFLRLRTSTGAHPQIREIATPLLRELQRIVPICFDDILPKEGEQ